MYIPRRVFVAGLLFILSLRAWGRLSTSDRSSGDVRKVTLARPGQGVAVSRDGLKIAVLYGWGAGIDIFRRDGTLLRRIKRRGMLITAEIAFLDNDQVVAPAGDDFDPDAMLQVWTAENGSPPRTIKGAVPGGGFLYNRAKNFAVGGGGRWIVALCDLRNADTVTVVDATTWEVWTIGLKHLLEPFDRITSVAAAELIAIGTIGGRMLIVDPASETLVRHIVVYPRGRDRPEIGIGPLAFGDSGRLVATGRTISSTSTVQEHYDSGAEGADGLKIWKVADGSLLRTASHEANTVRQIVSSDGLFVAIVNPDQLICVAPDQSVPITEKSVVDLTSVAVISSEAAALAISGKTLLQLSLPLGP